MPASRASTGLGSGSAAGDGESTAPTPEMAVSIVGVSTACSKDALVSSAEAVRKRLSTE